MKTLIAMTFVLACSIVPAKAQCNQASFGGVQPYSQTSYSGFPGYQQNTPAVGNIATCTTGPNYQKFVSASLFITINCNLTTEVGMYSNVVQQRHRFPWDPPTQYDMSSYGADFNKNQQVEITWNMVGDCNCYLSGTFSGNGGYFTQYGSGCF